MRPDIGESTGAEAELPEQSRSFVYADFVAPKSSSELDCARRFVVADAYARFRRDRGDAVLFATAVGAFAEQIESEATNQGISPSSVVDSLVERLQGMCELLEVSCDWTRSIVTSQPELCRRAQRIFGELFEKGLVYRHESSSESNGERPWLFRRARFAESCARGLDDLSGWTAEAVEAQRAALGPVEGVEIDAVLIGGGQISVFTPHPDAISDAAFIAMSPHHPEVETVASQADLEKLREDHSPVKLVQTEMQAAIPVVDGLIPVVVTPAVDARFGPTACLGIPDRDVADREIASRLSTSAGGLQVRTATASSKPRPSVRYRLPDRPVSRMGNWGIPIPIIDCHSCGLVCDGAEGLPPPSSPPTETDEADACRCPRCGEPAKRDPQVIDGCFDSMWAWLAIPTPLDDDLDHWLPAKQVVWSGPDGEQLLDERIAARAATELGELPGLDQPEPFSGACLCGAVDSGEELKELTAQAGADAVRLTILHTASAPKATSWSPSSFRHSQRFLQELRDYAKPRLTSRERPVPFEIDPASRLRRRLSAWCRIAEERVSASIDRLEMHKATYGLMLFLKRIRDFEARCEEDGAMPPLDHDAVVIALLRLARLAAPCIPHTAAELEAIAGEGRLP